MSQNNQKQSDTAHQGLTWRRIVAPLIDALVFVLIWWGVLAVTKVRFPFGVMQSFSQADYDAYVTLMTRLTLALFVLSLAMHALFKGSCGKLVTGLKVVRLDGTPMQFQHVLIRSIAMFLIGVMILAPGPLIAFLFGKGSEGASLISLAIGVLLWLGLTIAFRTQSLLERIIGIKTIRR
jgi:uncharacterized RDD family membrane protein YckC